MAIFGVQRVHLSMLLLPNNAGFAALQGILHLKSARFKFS